jgi:DNA-binding protein HU-beta
MNKAELVSAMAKEAGITKGQAERALNCMQSCVVDAVRKGEKVTLVGFGTFSSVQGQDWAESTDGVGDQNSGQASAQIRAGRLATRRRLQRAGSQEVMRDCCGYR